MPWRQSRLGPGHREEGTGLLTLDNTFQYTLSSGQCNTIKLSCSAKRFQSASQYNVTSKHSSHCFANAARSLPKHKTRSEKAEAKHPLADLTLQSRTSGWWSNSMTESPQGKVLLALPALKESSAAHEPYPSSASSPALAAARTSPCTALASSRLAAPPQGHEAKRLRAKTKEKPAPANSWEAEIRATWPERSQSTCNLPHLLLQVVFLNHYRVVFFFFHPLGWAFCGMQTGPWVAICHTAFRQRKYANA